MAELFGNPESTPESTPATPAQTPAPAATSEPVAPAAPQEAAPEPTPTNLFADQLASITSDDGRQKYADVPTALASIQHAQDHIKTLTDQVATLQTELESKGNMEEVIRRLESQSQQNVVEPPSTTGLDETKTVQLVEQLLQQKESKAAEEANRVEVVNALVQKFGDKAEEVYLSKAKELGVDEAFLTAVAKKSPKAVLEYFSATSNPTNPTTPSHTSTLQTPAPDQPDPMAIFKQGKNDLVTKWQSAKPKED